MEAVFGVISDGLESLGIKGSIIHLVSRVLCISFSTLGIVYIVARYVNPNLRAEIKRRVAVYAMFGLSFIVILWLDFLDEWTLHSATVFDILKYIFSSIFHYCISLIFYRVVCFNFFDIINIVLFDRLLKIDSKKFVSTLKTLTGEKKDKEDKEDEEDKKDEPKKKKDKKGT